MDLELARTFLEVAGAGSFVRAARQLHVTQSTVSMRVHLLEEQIGVRLFIRHKGGATLTVAGVQFQRHAAALIRIWQEACHEVALPVGYHSTLRVGGEAGLWNRWLHLWVPWMREHAADIALRCEVGLPDGLIHALLEGSLDLGVMYSPRGRPGLTVVQVAEEQLVLFRATGREGKTRSEEQVYVDWGEEFRRQYRMAFPDISAPSLFIGLGTLGFDYLLSTGGKGYFPKSLAQPYLESRVVQIIPDAPTFTLPIYAVYASDVNARVIDTALQGLRTVILPPASTDRRSRMLRCQPAPRAAPQEPLGSERMLAAPPSK